MRCVVQTVRDCAVTVEGETVGAIKSGLLVYVGVAAGDTEEDVSYLTAKVANLRVFPDQEGRMNLSVMDAGGEVLAVSQFTLYGDVRRGRRPSYDEAAAPAAAVKLYDSFLTGLTGLGIKTESGVFQARMEVTYTNLGPVTILVDSKKTF
jgi:D-aminoacyl-tRNA deacylase